MNNVGFVCCHKIEGLVIGRPVFMWENLFFFNISMMPAHALPAQIWFSSIHFNWNLPIWSLCLLQDPFRHSRCGCNNPSFHTSSSCSYNEIKKNSINTALDWFSIILESMKSSYFKCNFPHPLGKAIQTPIQVRYKRIAGRLFLV